MAHVCVLHLEQILENDNLFYGVYIHYQKNELALHIQSSKEKTRRTMLKKQSWAIILPQTVRLIQLYEKVDMTY